MGIAKLHMTALEAETVSRERFLSRRICQEESTCGSLKSESDGKEEKLSAAQQQKACVTEPVRCHLHNKYIEILRAYSFAYTRN